VRLRTRKSVSAMTMSFSTAVITWSIHQAINRRCDPLDTERARIGNEVLHVVTASPVFGNQSEHLTVVSVAHRSQASLTAAPPGGL
jgi:hypothetical protein